MVTEEHEKGIGECGVDASVQTVGRRAYGVAVVLLSLTVVVLTCLGAMYFLGCRHVLVHACCPCNKRRFSAMSNETDLPRLQSNVVYADHEQGVEI